MTGCKGAHELGTSLRYLGSPVFVMYRGPNAPGYVGCQVLKLGVHRVRHNELQHARVIKCSGSKRHHPDVLLSRSIVSPNAALQMLTCCRPYPEICANHQAREGIQGVAISVRMLHTPCSDGRIRAHKGVSTDEKTRDHISECLR